MLCAQYILMGHIHLFKCTSWSSLLASRKSEQQPAPAARPPSSLLALSMFVQWLVRTPSTGFQPIPCRQYLQSELVLPIEGLIRDIGFR